MIRFCPQCWNEVPTEAIACSNCGAALSEAVSFTEKLIAALRHREPTRAGLAIDLLTGWLPSRARLNRCAICLVNRPTPPFLNKPPLV